jgi:hypothetical protein
MPPRKKRITKKALFQKTIEIIQPILRLSDWKIMVVFSHSQRMKETATCEAAPEYKVAKIRLNSYEMPNLSHEEIVSTAIHEMLHCVLWELGEWGYKLSRKDETKLELSRKYEEAAVTNLEKIFLPLLEETINAELKVHGYYGVDLTFTDFGVSTER